MQDAILTKLNTYWDNKKYKYEELLLQEDSLYPITKKSISELACKDFVWWCAEESKKLENKETIVDELFTIATQNSIKKFFTEKTNTIGIVEKPIEELLTEKQMKYIKFLLYKSKDYKLTQPVEKISKKDASKVIDFLVGVVDGKTSKVELKDIDCLRKV